MVGTYSMRFYQFILKDLASARYHETLVLQGIAIPACFLNPFDWKDFSQSFTLRTFWLPESPLRSQMLF
ncbi:hypothetical protein STEG23_028782 [Scotinomys teguina]